MSKAVKAVKAETQEFKFSAETVALIGETADLYFKAKKTNMMVAEALHDEGIQAMWLIEPTKDKPNDSFRADVNLALNTAIVARMSDYQKYLLSTDVRLMPPRSKSGERRDREDALKDVSRIKSVILKGLMRIEKDLETDPAEREAQKQLMAWAVWYLDEGIKAIDHKPKHLTNVRKFEAIEVFKVAQASIKKLTKVVG